MRKAGLENLPRSDSASSMASSICFRAVSRFPRSISVRALPYNAIGSLSLELRL